MARAPADSIEVFRRALTSGRDVRSAGRKIVERMLAGEGVEATRCFAASDPEGWEAMIRGFLGGGRSRRARDARTGRLERLLAHPATTVDDVRLLYRIARRSMPRDTSVEGLRNRLGAEAVRALLGDVDLVATDEGDLLELAALAAEMPACISPGVWAGLGPDALLFVWSQLRDHSSVQRAALVAVARDMGEPIAIAALRRIGGEDWTEGDMGVAADLADAFASREIWGHIASLPPDVFQRFWRAFVKPRTKRSVRIAMAAEMMPERGVRLAIEAHSEARGSARDLEILGSAIGEDIPVEAARQADRDGVRLGLRLLANRGDEGVARIRERLALALPERRRSRGNLDWSEFLFNELEETGILPGFPCVLLAPEVEDAVVQWILANLMRRGNNRELQEVLLDLRRHRGARGIAEFLGRTQDYADQPAILDAALEGPAAELPGMETTQPREDEAAAVLLVLEDFAHIVHHLAGGNAELMRTSRVSLLCRRVNRRVKDLLGTWGLSPSQEEPCSSVPFSPRIHQMIDGSSAAAGEDVVLVTPAFHDRQGALRASGWVARKSAAPTPDA